MNFLLHSSLLCFPLSLRTLFKCHLFFREVFLGLTCKGGANQMKNSHLAKLKHSGCNARLYSSFDNSFFISLRTIAVDRPPFYFILFYFTVRKYLERDSIKSRTSSSTVSRIRDENQFMWKEFYDSKIDIDLALLLLLLFLFFLSFFLAASCSSAFL